jgi:hypothetical protein
MDISQIVQGIAQQMEIDRKLILAQIPHPGEMGGQLEESLRAFLRKYLPEKYQIGTGHVVGRYYYPDKGKDQQDISRQVDVVLFNRIDFAPILNAPGYQIYPQECVEVAIEVNATLYGKELKEAVNNIQRVKVLAFPNEEAERGREIIGVIFAYNTRYRQSKHPSAMHNVTCQVARWIENLDPQWEAVDMVCVLDTGVAVRRSQGWSVYPVESNEPLLVLWFWLSLLLRAGIEDYLEDYLNLESSDYFWNPQVECK